MSRLPMNNGIEFFAIAMGEYPTSPSKPSPGICKTSDGGSIPVKYDGRKEKALCELLKSLLPDSEEEES